MSLGKNFSLLGRCLLVTAVIFSQVSTGFASPNGASDASTVIIKSKKNESNYVQITKRVDSSGLEILSYYQCQKNQACISLGKPEGYTLEQLKKTSSELRNKKYMWMAINTAIVIGGIVGGAVTGVQLSGANSVANAPMAARDGIGAVVEAGFKVGSFLVTAVPAALIGATAGGAAGAAVVYLVSPDDDFGAESAALKEAIQSDTEVKISMTQFISNLSLALAQVK